MKAPSLPEPLNLTDLSIRRVIRSRGRTNWVTTRRLVQYATLVVPEDEAEAYQFRSPANPRTASRWWRRGGSG